LPAEHKTDDDKHRDRGIGHNVDEGSTEIVVGVYGRVAVMVVMAVDMMIVAVPVMMVMLVAQ